MSKKPQPKREMAIRWANKGMRYISVNASSDAAAELTEYGLLVSGQRKSCYILYVDARYDFDEVVAYIESYG